MKTSFLYMVISSISLNKYMSVFPFFFFKEPKHPPHPKPQCLPDFDNSSRQGFRKPRASSQKCQSSDVQLPLVPFVTFGFLAIFCFLGLATEISSEWSFFPRCAQTVYIAAGSRPSFGPISSTASSLFPQMTLRMYFQEEKNNRNEIVAPPSLLL